jgi:hypothetical protein
LPENRPFDDAGGGQPLLHRGDRAGDRAAADGDHRAGAFLVGLGPADGDAKTFRAFLEVGDVERDQLGSPGGQCEAEQQQRAIALTGQVGLAAGGRTLSEVAAAFLMGATPSVRRAPRMTVP